MKNNVADIFKYYGMKEICEEYKEKIKTGEDEDFIETIPFLESYWLTRLDIWIVANYYKLPIILLYYPNMTLIETQLSFSTLSTYFYDTSEVVDLQEADAERRRDSSSESESESEKEQENEEEEEGLSGMGMDMGMGAPASRVSKKYMQEYYFIVVPRIKNEGVEIPTYSIISKDDKYLLPLSAIRPQVQDKIIEEMSKHYVSSSDISSGRGTGISMDDLDSVFERELKKDELTDSKEYIVSFVRNFNLYKLLKEREHTMSVFSAESQTPPPEFDVVGQGLGESQGENPQIFPVEEQPPIGKSKKHVMPPSSIRMEKENTKKITPLKAEVAPKPTASKKATPKPKALSVAPLSIFKEPTEVSAEVIAEAPVAPVAPAEKPKTSAKKPRQKGVATLKLNLNPTEEDTPLQPVSASAPAPLLLPTFQAKTGSKKLKPITMGASVAAAAAAAAPEADQPLSEQNPEGEEK
jgi:hypothetical protein